MSYVFSIIVLFLMTVCGRFICSKNPVKTHQCTQCRSDRRRFSTFLLFQ